MANYSITNSTVFAGNTPQTITTTYQTILGVAASSAILNPPVAVGLRRGKLYDLLVGTAGTPADFSYEWEVARNTALNSTGVWLGSLSSVSSGLPLDLADVGCAAFTVNNCSAQTNQVVSGQAWYVGINQRASYRWVAAPGSEIVYPATSSAGLSLLVRSVSGGTAVATGTIFFQEQ